MVFDVIENFEYEGLAREGSSAAHITLMGGAVGSEFEMMRLTFSLCRRGRDWLSAPTF